MSSKFRSIRGRTVTLGQGIPQDESLLDPEVFVGSIIYTDSGEMKYSDGTNWVLFEGGDGANTGAQGTTGIQGSTGPQGIQGERAPGFDVIGEVDLAANDAYLDTNFPSANTGDAVIQQTDDTLWILTPNEWINVGSFRGVQGFQGTQGVQGLQGNIGEEGIQGSRGFRGNQGVQGFQGSTGIQGNQGVQGNQGTQGLQGVQGVQGIQGIQGDLGIQGTQGVQSLQGTTGIQGNDGIQGFGGDDAGLVLEYRLKNSIVEADPLQGGLIFNGGLANTDSFGLVTKIWIDEEDNFGIDVTGLLDAVVSSNSANKAYFKIVERDDPSDYVIFSVQDMTANTGGSYYEADVTFLAGTATKADFTFLSALPATYTEKPLVFSIDIAGDRGFQGIQGFQGTTGIQGDTGIQGLVGNQGIQGEIGPQGIQGTQGYQGTQGIQGLQGFQGTTGIQGNDGVQGFTGDHGGFTWEYLYSDNNNTDTAPPLRSWKINSSDIRTANTMAIDDIPNNSYSNQLDEFFDYLQAIPGTPKGQILIESTADNDGPAGHHFVGYEINGITWDSGSKAWAKFDITYIGSGAVTGFDWDNVLADHGADTLISFIPAGPRGVQGIQGVQGLQGNDGFQGTQGATGDTGLQGAQGTQGIQGLQGLQGTQGFQGQQGTTGIQGDLGFQGLQGEAIQGSQGFQGATGIQGDSGNQGTQGFQGTQGHQGIQGLQGLQGDTGAGVQGTQGVQGVQGIQGEFGVQGADGGFGGATFDYTFEADTNASDPGIGRLKFNNGTLSSATEMYIDDRDDDFNDLQSYLRTIDDSTSVIKGHFKVTDGANAANFVIYTIDTLTEESGYFKIDCTHLNGSVTSFTDDGDVRITFARTGDKGDPGIQGAQGTDGIQGADGLQGADGAGTQGVQGIQGLGGNDGTDGVQGLQGTDGTGAQGIQGVQGTAGNDGSDGTQGAQGVQGLQGNQGTQGPQGIQGESGAGAGGTQGTQGVQGPQGTQGLQGDLGPAGFGAQGIQGIQGFQGQAGQDGAQGLQGGDGSGTQGVQGITGSVGEDGIQGLQGLQGDQAGGGTQGIQGFQGFQGVQGETGAGIQGAQGIQGEFGGGGIGLQGTQGTQGMQGLQGEGAEGGSQGIQGTQGMQGLQGTSASGGSGLQGIQGPQGTQGFQGAEGGTGGGAQGIQGIQGGGGVQGENGGGGFQGIQGVQGHQGLQGPLGTGSGGNQGFQGAQGIQGNDGFQGGEGSGIQGAQGIQGTQGSLGEDGFQGIQGLQGLTAESAEVGISDIYTSTLQQTSMFIPMVAGGTGSRQSYTTASPNPGGESNFFYQASTDTLTLENISIQGNLAVAGTINGATGNYLESDAFAQKTAGNLRMDDNLELEFGTGGDSHITFDGSDLILDNVNAVGFFYLKQQAVTKFTFNIGSGEFIATGDINAQSDERVKQNVEDIDNALDKVTKLRGVYFERIAQPGERKVGVIAQEVERVVPELVSTDEEGMKSVSYANMAGLLIEAVKELKEEVDDLKEL